MTDISRIIQQKLARLEQPEKARWLENYVKHDIKSRGVGIPDIRKVVIEVNREYKLSAEPFTNRAKVLNELIHSAYTEDKLAAILFLQLYGNDTEDRAVLALIAGWFAQEQIADWNVCDWMCVRILTPMVDNRPGLMTEEMKSWNKSTNLWQARASLVPFAQSKTLRQHREVIASLAAVLIKREERFCKTAVGWVLREYSKIDQKFVKDFLSRHEDWLTKEVIRNATRYMKQ